MATNGGGNGFIQTYPGVVPSPQDLIGPIKPDRSDPAFQPPRDPLADPGAKARATLIYRELPNRAVQSSWSVSDVRTALEDLSEGLFDQPAQLVDAVLAEPRVQATVGSRTGGLLGRPLRFSPSTLPGVEGSRAARECLDAWRTIWPRTFTEPVLSEVQTWAMLMSFAPGQILWDTTQPIWSPHLRFFHPRYCWYHWILRRYVAITLDGQVAIEPGDGHWFLHAPHGEHRGWMRAGVRAVAEPWLITRFTYRDWARHEERHGMPQILAYTPAAGDPEVIAQFRADLQQLGQETVVELPQGVDKQFSYDMKLLESSDGAWQGFDGLIQRCERAIVLALLGQNLSTEVKEGSFAAARVHADVRQSFLEADARALAHTIYAQIARPFAEFNFGDADLAPWVSWDVSPIEDAATAADVLVRLSSSIKTLRDAGLKVTNVEQLARNFGVDVELEEAPPIAPSGPKGEAAPEEDA